MLPSIRERNLNFVNLSDAEKRVAIAKDVITQLNLRLLIAQSGVYVERQSEYDIATKTYVEKGCNVCAIGAAAVSVMNGAAVGISNWKMRDALVANGFTYGMLIEMEACFEGGYSGWDAAYGYPYPESDEDGSYDTHLRRCFQHIVDNKGEWNAEAMGGTLID